MLKNIKMRENKKIWYKIHNTKKLQKIIYLMINRPIYLFHYHQNEKYLLVRRKIQVYLYDITTKLNKKIDDMETVDGFLSKNSR